LEKEDTEIKQQDMTLPVKDCQVWIQWGDSSISQNPITALVDKLGRVYLSVDLLGGGKKKVKGVSFTGRRLDIRKVEYTEPRYEGENLKYLVCYLEGK
jgi:hypothetical protein